MLTKEDYMKLDKERLAELLVEKDREEREKPFQIPFVPKEQGTCPYGGNCTNPFHDCVNCPGVFPEWCKINTTTGATLSTSAHNDKNFNSSTTNQPNKYGSITPTDVEEDNKKYVETYRVLKEFRGERAYEIKVEKALDFVIGLLKEKIY